MIMTKLIAAMLIRSAMRRGGRSLTFWLRDNGWSYRGSGNWEHPRHGHWESGYAVYEQWLYDHRRTLMKVHFAYLTVIAIVLILGLTIF